MIPMGYPIPMSFMTVRCQTAFANDLDLVLDLRIKDLRIQTFKYMTCFLSLCSVYHLFLFTICSGYIRVLGPRRNSAHQFITDVVQVQVLRLLLVLIQISTFGRRKAKICTLQARMCS